MRRVTQPLPAAAQRRRRRTCLCAAVASCCLLALVRWRARGVPWHPL